MSEERSIILSIVAYPRQVLGVPPKLISAGALATIGVSVLVGLVTGDVIQTELLPAYLVVHMFLRRLYLADPHVEKVLTRRWWNGYPHGAPMAGLAYARGTRNRLHRRRGTARFT